MKQRQAIVRLTAKGFRVEVEEILDESRAGDCSTRPIRRLYVPCPGTRTRGANDLELGQAVRRAVAGT